MLKVQESHHMVYANEVDRLHLTNDHCAQTLERMPEEDAVMADEHALELVWKEQHNLQLSNTVTALMKLASFDH